MGPESETVRAYSLSMHLPDLIKKKKKKTIKENGQKVSYWLFLFNYKS